MTIQTRTPTVHICLDDQGRAWIDDTNVKVIEVVLDHRCYGWSAEQIYQEHEKYLSMGQIHAALGYYYDHQEEFDAEIARQKQEYEQLLQAEGQQTPVHQRLRGAGLLSQERSPFPR